MASSSIIWAPPLVGQIIGIKAIFCTSLASLKLLEVQLSLDHSFTNYIKLSGAYPQHIVTTLYWLLLARSWIILSELDTNFGEIHFRSKNKLALCNYLENQAMFYFTLIALFLLRFDKWILLKLMSTFSSKSINRLVQNLFMASKQLKIRSTGIKNSGIIHSNLPHTETHICSSY